MAKRKCVKWGRSGGRKVCRKYSTGRRGGSERRQSSRRGKCQTVTVRGHRKRVCRNAKGRFTRQ